MAKEKAHDSTAHNEERRARMKAEAEENAQAQTQAEDEHREKRAERELKSRTEEDQLLTQHANLIAPGESRDQLLERIRQMRAEALAEPPAPPPLTEYMQQQLDIEQKAGADAVKKAAEEMERNREIRRKTEEEQARREGTMNPVHHPNPGQHEQYPAQGATLGKTKK
jgi:hypothetical protein